MLKKIVAIAFGAGLALAPLAALAQTDQSTAPAAPAAGATAAPAAPSGSHRSQMRHRRSMSHHRARASAEHMKQMSKPAAPQSSPDSAIRLRRQAHNWPATQFLGRCLFFDLAIDQVDNTVAIRCEPLTEP